MDSKNEFKKKYRCLKYRNAKLIILKIELSREHFVNQILMTFFYKIIAKEIKPLKCKFKLMEKFKKAIQTKKNLTTMQKNQKNEPLFSKL